MLKQRTSLREDLYQHLLRKRGIWIHSGTLEKFSMNRGNKGSTGSRRLRELNEEGLIWREDRKNKKTGVSTVWYQVPKTVNRLTYRININK